MKKIGPAEYGLVLVLGVFVWLKIIYSLPRFSDGNAYMYMAKLVGQGAVPYRDFFFASPPLLVYVYALYGKVFGFNWQSFNYLPVLLSVIDGLVIYFLFRNAFGKLARLSAVTVYLFSFAVLSTTDFYSGIHLALTLVLLGTFAMVRRWPLLAGVLFALAVLGKLYVVVLVAALLVYMLFRRKWREAFKILIGFVVVVGVVGLIFWVLAGQQFLYDVFLNHLHKVAGIPKGRILKFFVTHDWWLLLGTLPMFWWRRWVPGIIVLPVLAGAVYVAVFSDVYYLHLKMLVVWLALWWGWNVAQAWKRWPRWQTVGVVSVLLVAVVVTGLWQYIGQQAEAAVINNIDDITASVARLTEKGQPIYGDYTITPLLALAADRMIFRNYVDVNPMYFDGGVFDYAKRAAELRAAKVKTIITKGTLDKAGNLVTGPETVLPRDFYDEYCRVARAFPIEQDYEHNTVIIWQCEY